MTDEGRSAAAAEELASASEELRAAEALLGAGIPRVAVARGYFAVFHAIRALLYTEGLEPRSHHGTLHLFNLHFVKTGRFEPVTSSFAAKLQKFREEADYGVAFVIDEPNARKEIDQARRLVERIAQQIVSPPT